jgi:hypothetical protein
LSDADLQDRIGVYRNKTGNYVIITTRENKLFWYAGARTREIRMIREIDGVLAVDPDALSLRFDRGSPTQWIDVSVGDVTAGDGATARYYRTAPQAVFHPQNYEGRYESRELGVFCQVALAAEGLSVQFDDGPTLRLLSTGTDRALVRGMVSEITFTRDQTGQVMGFVLNSLRARGVQFVRA